MLRVRCPECGESFALHPAMTGKDISCPKCKSKFQTARGAGRATTDDYTGVVELGVRQKGGGGGEKKKLDPKVVLLGLLGVVILGLVLYFMGIFG